jgi:outer membrane immunogenic protein
MSGDHTTLSLIVLLRRSLELDLGAIMKLLSALFASVGVALSTASLAADLPTRKEAPAPVPYVAPFTWTGFYIGGYAGGSFGSVDWSGPLFSGGTVTHGGFDIGGLAGFNYQFGGAWVIGAEAEFGAFINGNDNVNVSRVVGDTTFNLNERFRDTGVGRLRGRLGYAVQPNTLLYIAGGWTFANSNISITGTCTPCATPPFTVSQNRWLNGFNIGGGVEYAFTSNWIIRGEYIFDGFSRENLNFGFVPPNFAEQRQVFLNVNTLRAAIEYKF